MKAAVPYILSLNPCFTFHIPSEASGVEGESSAENWSRAPSSEKLSRERERPWV